MLWDIPSWPMEVLVACKGFPCPAVRQCVGSSRSLRTQDLGCLTPDEVSLTWKQCRENSWSWLALLGTGLFIMLPRRPMGTGCGSMDWGSRGLADGENISMSFCVPLPQVSHCFSLGGGKITRAPASGITPTLTDTGLSPICLNSSR